MMHEEGSASVSLSPLQLLSLFSLSPNSFLQNLKLEDRGILLIQLLLSCATQVATGNLHNSNQSLHYINLLSSPTGDSLQRVASYFSEALADRTLKAFSGIYSALNSNKFPFFSEILLARKIFFELCPFLKLVYVVANQAILDAIAGEKVVHIIDLHSAEPVQWVALLQALRIRPDGPPHLRISGVHDQKEVLDQMAKVLIAEAEKLDIPFQFDPIVCKLENLNLELLRIRTGEARVINSILQLHALLAGDDENGAKSSTPSSHLNSVQLQKALKLSQITLGELMEKDHMSPDSVVSSSSPPPAAKMESFLASLWSLSPKIMVLAEQEADHNGGTLTERVGEALHYYGALFDCLDSTLPRTSIDRMRVEKMIFGEEIKNIIASEGGERRERHEKMERWAQRMEIGGFGRMSLSYHGQMQARRMLQSHGCDGFKIKDLNGSFFICWHEQALFSVSAWSCRRFD